MKILIDVGAHEGQTLEEAVKDRWQFERIYAFEPMPKQYAKLVDRFGGNDRVVLMNCGLLDETCERPLYGSNEFMEASVWRNIQHADPTIVTPCRFIMASDFVDALPGEATIVMKLNCEGSEVLILDCLMDTGAIHRLSNVMIDFDIRKVPGRQTEADRILARMAEKGFGRYSLCDDVMLGATHQDRIANWLGSLACVV